MSDGVCLPHTTEVVDATKCSSFSQTELDVCDSCSGNQIKFDVVNYCAAVEEIDKDANCATYNSDGECSSCIKGYYIIDKKCLKITIDNCTIAIENGELCTECIPSELENFHISFGTENNKCNFSHSHIIHDCVATDQIVQDAVSR